MKNIHGNFGLVIYFHVPNITWKNKGYAIFNVTEIINVTLDKSLAFIFVSNSIK